VSTSARQAQLVEAFGELVGSDRLPARGREVFAEIEEVAGAFLGSGELPLPEDPFRGGDRQLALDSDLYYVMFWRMFDRTPAAMMQDLAIQLRLILAKRIFKRCGDDVVFHHNVLFSSGRNLEIGDGVLVNRDVMLDDRAPIVVGDHTGLAAGVVIETHSHVYDDFSQPLFHAGRRMAPVRIGSNCLIGHKAAVMAGVTIGDRCIVASNSVVTHDVPDRTIVGGVPAKPIKEIVPRVG
jgi:acetyltransferase-like isoleucine patch superfamily enzyme